MFSLNWGDFVKGLVTAIISAVIVTLYGVISVSGFDFFSADWNVILHNVVNVGVVTFVSYMVKNFVTDNQGKVAGVLPTEPKN